MTDLDDKRWDAIVVGSGIGGMATAAALSRVGHEVLLLEQHEILGGLTHSFSRDAFTWNVGIHYLNYVAPGEPIRELIDWLSDTPIKFASMGAVYDTLHIGSAEALPLSRPYEAQELDLKERFPEELEAIEAWTAALRAGREAMDKILPTRAMPELAGDVLQWWNRRAITTWCGRTTQDVIADITDHPELAAVFAAQWADHGGRPTQASFAMHALTAGGYLDCGAWYPVGGGSAFADHLIPTITKHGGAARAGVRVDRLLFDGEAVVGVRTEDGTEIRADAVISDIGARETVDFLLPDDCGHDDWIREIRSLTSSIAHFNLFLGFEGDIEAAGATKSNHWVYPTGDVDAVWTDAPDGVPPGLFMSFESLKDPAHDPGPRQRHTGEVYVWADWSTVARWADTRPGARPDDYHEFKRRAEETILAQFRAAFPDIAELVVFHDLATPLTTVSFTGHREGAFYGLEVTPERVMSDALRAKTPIEGLYLAGQDVACPGVPGALWGGLLAAASVDPKAFAKLRG
ncbi:MAG: NAD(P)/FAD-dependent oxidoreductase [Rhodothermaceae bacterium]|nr:NAD(P)/FAD-dependent oxidoreductase [Rhodothermaceae bacterium]